MQKAQKKKLPFAALAQAVIQSFQERNLWMRLSNQAWLDMAEVLFDLRQLYENLQVTRDTFKFILRKIEGQIMGQDPPMHRAVSAKD